MLKTDCLLWRRGLVEVLTVMAKYSTTTKLVRNSRYLLLWCHIQVLFIMFFLKSTSEAICYGYRCVKVSILALVLLQVT